jgi:hypothetical protein
MALYETSKEFDEALFDIERRVYTEGMTWREAIRACVAANPTPALLQFLKELERLEKDGYVPRHEVDC